MPRSGDIHIAAANSPIKTLTLETLLADPDQLFLDPFALNQLQQQLELQPDAGALPTGQGLRRAAHGAMRLAGLPDSRLRLSYAGSSARLGEIMVEFYGERLRQRVAEGAARRPASEAGPDRFQVDGRMNVAGVATPWSAERLPRASFIFVLSLLAVLLLIGLLELSDPSFKSERQIARYLDLPVLGSMPDATQLARHLKEG